MKLTNREVLPLIEWYHTNKRNLPWRDTNDPYDVWLSEIMLQQTRVEFVKTRFMQFKESLPTIQALAKCEDDTLLKLWEGMGYYSRVKNLRKCAQELVKNHNSVLPQTPGELKMLPGIGPYTAGAISAIAYGHPAAAVDGNVLRVFARLFNDTSDIRNNAVRIQYETIILDYLHDTTLSKEDISSFTQALMELGAIVCVPNGEPHCNLCPWQKLCKSYLNKTTDSVPYKSPLKERKIVNRTIFIIRDGERILIHKRPAKGLLSGLYEFPGTDQHLSKKEALSYLKTFNLVPVRIKKLPDSKHIFTHLEWHMIAYEITIGTPEPDLDYLFVTKKELVNYAVPSAFKAYLQYYSLTD